MQMAGGSSFFLRTLVHMKHSQPKLGFSDNTSFYFKKAIILHIEIYYIQRKIIYKRQIYKTPSSYGLLLLI